MHESCILLGSVPLRRVEEFKVLGVTFDRMGTLKMHISVKSTKGLPMMGFVKRTCFGFHESSSF